jgi:hypothetical protein
MSGWKGFERRCAKALGGRRRPVTGIDRHDGDVFTDMFEIQCKVRQGQPSYLKAWLAGIVKTATERQKIGIVIWKESGTGFPDSEALVVLRLSDWVDLHGAVDARFTKVDEGKADGSATDPSSLLSPRERGTP